MIKNIKDKEYKKISIQLLLLFFKTINFMTTLIYYFWQYIIILIIFFNLSFAMKNTLKH